MTKCINSLLSALLTLSLVFQLTACSAYSDNRLSMETQPGNIEWQSIANKYVAEKKGWGGDQYYLERLPDEDGTAIVEVVNRDDRKSPVPGAGKSFLLIIDKNRGIVLEELSYQ